MGIMECKGTNLLQQPKASVQKVCSTEAGHELDCVDLDLQKHVAKVTAQVATTTMPCSPEAGAGEGGAAAVPSVRKVRGQEASLRRLLRGTVSLQGGKFKDLVDELQAEMDRNTDARKRSARA